MALLLLRRLLLRSKVVLVTKCFVEGGDNERVLRQHEDLGSLEVLHTLALRPQLVYHLFDYFLERVAVPEIARDIAHIDHLTRLLLHRSSSLLAQCLVHLLDELKLHDIALLISLLLQLP